MNISGLRRRALIGATISVAAVVACGDLLPLEVTSGVGAADAGARLNEGPCDPHAPVTGVRRLEGVDDPAADEANPSLSPDENSIFFHRVSKATLRSRLFRATRSSSDFSFDNVVELGRIASWATTSGALPESRGEMDVSDPTVSADGQRLLFVGGDATQRTVLFSATLGPSGDFENPVPLLPTLESADRAPFLSSGGDLYLVRAKVRTVLFAPNFDSGVTLTEGDSAAVALKPIVSRDEGQLYFARDGGGSLDIFFADLTRDGGSVKAGAAARLMPVDIPVAPMFRTPGWVSHDHCRLYFTSNAHDAKDVGLYVAWRTSRP